MEPMLVIKPGDLEHWFTEEERFFRLLPGHGSEWHGQGVHVVTSGKGAAGRNFEIGEHSREEMEKLYPPDMYEEDEMHRVRIELRLTSATKSRCRQSPFTSTMILIAVSGLASTHCV